MKIGITSSPNSTQEITAHLFNNVKNESLNGAIVKIEADTDYIIIAQLNDLKTSNRWHENTQIAPIISSIGSLPYFTGDSDVTIAKATVLGAYIKVSGKWRQSILGSPIGTGYTLEKVSKELIKEITQDTCNGNYYYIGKLYGADDSVAPLDLRHYGYSVTGEGHGEAYMGGIFGPSGSGKSVMTASIVAGFARNNGMGILIIDPQGEFKLNKMNKPSFPFDFHSMLESNSKGRFNSSNALGITEIQIDDVDAFIQVLDYYNFVRPFTKAKKSEVLEEFGVYLERKRKQKIKFYLEWDEMIVNNPNFKDEFIDIVAKTYSDREKKRLELAETWDEDIFDIAETWNRAVELFKEGGKKKVDNIIEQVLNYGKIYILDISADEYGLGDEFKKLILNYIMKKMRGVMYKSFRRGKKDTNALIVIDEAHLFAGHGEERGSIGEDLSRTLTQNIAMMRKLNCGVMLCTQFITQVRREIFRQLHYRIYATGLIGPDKEYMKEKEGDEGVTLYEALPDPKKSRKYCYMVGGNLGCLGNTGKPLVLEGFSGGGVELLKENI